MPSSVFPTEVRAPRGARFFEIGWSDGSQTRYPHRLLRGFCPCAHCQGHQGPVVFHASGDPGLLEIEEVGNYALRLLWSDGHGTGIYSFQMFRQLRELSKWPPERWRGVSLPR
mgnify:CR=1 FL=1